MIAIRVDANTKIGAGHIMRCIAIANELVRQQQEVVFITADEYPYKLIKQWGFRHVVLKTDYTNMDNELAKLVFVIEEYKIDCIIVDSYFATELYFKQLKKLVATVYIEDVAQKLISCDMIINYNISFAEFEYARIYNTADTKLLLGTSYVPLREEFSCIQPVSIRKGIHDILITTGSTDPYKISTTLAKRILKSKHFHDMNVHIVVGQYYCDKEKLNLLAKRFNRIIIHENVNVMSKLMLECDIAISASGSTLYELSSCGVPCIIFSFADNQTLIRDYFGKSGAMIDCGDVRNNTKKCIDSIIKALILLKSNKKRAELQSRAMTITDGKGAQRLVENILSLIKYKKLSLGGEKCK